MDNYYPAKWSKYNQGEGPSSSSATLPAMPTETIVPGTKFLTNSPPDVTVDTHVIELLGISNIFQLTAPQNDGWFVSDFYLMNALLQGMGKSQTWMTCADPLGLVEEYKECLHGNIYTDSKAVLNMNQKPHDITVVSDQELLPSFLATLNRVCGHAYENRDKVLVLIFGHGDENAFGIIVGTELGKPDQDDWPRLKPEVFAQTVHNFPLLHISLFLTSCYSGGWVVYPQLGGEIQDHAIRSITAATNADLKSKNLPVPSNPVRTKPQGGFRTTNFIYELSSEEAEPRELQHFTGDLVATIDNVTDKSDFKQQITFSAQDDDWRSNWHGRVGISLDNFKARCDNLRTINPTHPFPTTGRSGFQESDMNHPGILAWRKRHPENILDRGNASITMWGLFEGRSMNAMSSMLQSMARDYMNSHPGRNSLSKNVPLHNLALRCIQNQPEHPMSLWEMKRLHGGLKYRNNISHLAEAYATSMRLVPFFKMHEFDSDAWTVEIVTKDPELQALHQSAKSFFGGRQFWPSAGLEIGDYWTKPRAYLVAACVHARLGKDQIEERIEAAMECK